MAERRCFSRKVVESDAFQRLTPSCQTLYLHLNMAADDDGFINCAGAIVTMNRCREGDLKRLVDAGFLLKFGDIYVVKHWRISNSLKNDRQKEPAYPVLAARIFVKSNRAYSLREDSGGKSLLEIKTGRRMESKSESILDSQPNRTEQKGTEPKGTEAAFQALYDAYPAHRRGRFEDGLGIYIGYAPEQRKQMLQALECWKRSAQWQRQEGQYVPLLVNWLTRGYWLQPPADGRPSGILGEPELEAIRQILKEEL